MFKNGVIAVLITLLILQHPAYAPHRHIMVFLAMAAALFIAISILEDEVDKYKRAKYRQRKFKERADDIHLLQDRRQA